MLDWIAGFIILIVKLTLVVLVLLVIAAYLVWVERKFLARLQIRYGPNRAGTFGLLQPLADVVKMITKEDTVPDRGGQGAISDSPGRGGDHRLPHVLGGPVRPGPDLMGA